MAVGVRKVRAYSRGGRSAGRVRGYVRHGGGFNRRTASLGKGARTGRVFGFGRSTPKASKKLTGGGRHTRAGKVGGIRHATATHRYRSAAVPNRASTPNRSVKRTAARTKAPAVGKTRRHVTGTGKSNLTGKKTGRGKLSQTSPSKKPKNRTPRNAQPVGDINQAIASMIRGAPKGPRGIPVGGKGVVRIGPDRRTAEQKRNPRKVRKA